MLNYQHKTQPFAHQAHVLNVSAYCEYFGLLMEQRTGKSKVVLDTAAVNHRDGRINSLFIVAPNGVHRNWVTDEIPAHLPDWVQRYAVFWTGATSKKHLAELENLFNRGPQLRILTMNFEALGTKRGFDFAARFINATDCMMAVDESTRIKNPTAGVTKAVMKLRDRVKMRRILNGTPSTQSPLDVYSQLLFLSEETVPVSSYVAFKARYADFLPASHPMVRGIMNKTGSRFPPQIIATDAEGRPQYKNLDELKRWVDKCCYRVTRNQCVDMPEKLYKRWDVELPAAHMKLVQHHLQAMRTGATPEPINKMVSVMLYQRLICGVIPKQLTGTGETTDIYTTPMDNPRIQAVLEIADAYPDASIIFWARFRRDLAHIADALTAHTGKPVARYWGDIGDDEREAGKVAFQRKEVQYFVGQQGAGGVGLPLHAADVMVYHSNTFSLYHRLQSEDRAENLMKTRGTLIIDIETPNTVDTKIIRALRSKKDVADLITGDETIDWLE